MIKSHEANSQKAPQKQIIQESLEELVVKTTDKNCQCQIDWYLIFTSGSTVVRSTKIIKLIKVAPYFNQYMRGSQKISAFFCLMAFHLRLHIYLYKKV